MSSDDEERQREAVVEQLRDSLAVRAEHGDMTKIEAFRQMCECAIAAFERNEL